MNITELQTVTGCGIYKIQSPSGKLYIGQSKNIKQRYRHHLHYNSTSTKLGRSYLKYGKDNHIFTVVEYCDIKELSERELYYINYYNSREEGLNILDRNYTYLHTESVNKKIKEGVTKSWTPERRENQAKAMIENWEKGRYSSRDNSIRKPNPMYSCRRADTLELVTVPLEEFKNNRHLYVGNSANKKQPSKQKKVLDVQSGTIYEGVVECMRLLKIGNSAFYRKIKQGELQYTTL
jgi:group I intron endonuclease